MRYPTESYTLQGELGKANLLKRRQDQSEEVIECPSCQQAVVEWTGWFQEEVYDKESEVVVWEHKWHPEDHEHRPRCTDKVKTYRIEKWVYWFKGYDRFTSIQIRGRDPFEGIGPFTYEDIHKNHTFDHVSNKWIDGKGEVWKWPKIVQLKYN